MQNTQAINVKAGSAVATGSVTVSDSMPGVPCPDPAGYKYVGARYVPLFAEPAEWNINSTYEPLTIVLNEGNSYTSKQFVPVGIQIDNEEYWALTGNYNAQVEQYRQLVNQHIEEANQNFDKLFQFYTRPEWYGAVGDGAVDDSQAVQEAINSGKAVRFDGQYRIENVTLIDGSILYGDGTLIQKTENVKALSGSNISNVELSVNLKDNPNSLYNTRSDAAFVFTECENLNFHDFTITTLCDRTLNFVSCNQLSCHDVYCDTDFGSAITFNTCNDAQLYNVIVYAKRSTNYHSLDAYATNGSNSSNLMIHDIMLINGNSLQCTADQEQNSEFINLRINNVHSKGGLLCIKTDGLKDTYLHNCSADGGSYSFSFGGASTTSINSVVLDSCYINNAQAGQPVVTMSSGNTLVLKNCTLIGDYNTIATNDIVNIYVNGCFMLGTANFYDSSTTTETFVLNSCQIITPTISLPSANNTIIQNNYFNLNTTTRVQLFAKNTAVFNNNQFTGTLPDSFRFNVANGKLFYSGNTQNAIEFKLSADDSCKNAYTYQSIHDSRP